MKIRETTQHGQYRDIREFEVEVITEITLRAGLAGSPYNDRLSESARHQLAYDLRSYGVGEHGWARYEVLDPDWQPLWHDRREAGQ